MLIVKVDTDNAAFDGADFGPECARLLRKMADAVEDYDGTTTYRTVFDVNGNDVGRWKADPSGEIVRVSHA